MKLQEMTLEEMNERRAIGRAKYNKDSEFHEPVVRCDACQKLLLTANLKKDGFCPCGNTRVRNLRSLIDDAEMEQLFSMVEAGDVDPDFALLLVEVAK